MFEQKIKETTVQIYGILHSEARHIKANKSPQCNKPYICTARKLGQKLECALLSGSYNSLLCCMKIRNGEGMNVIITTLLPHNKSVIA